MLESSTNEKKPHVNMEKLIGQLFIVSHIKHETSGINQLTTEVNSFVSFNLLDVITTKSCYFFRAGHWKICDLAPNSRPDNQITK